MSTRANDPARPCIDYPKHKGMTIREVYALEIFKSLIPEADIFKLEKAINEKGTTVTAKLAVSLADDLLSKLEAKQ